MIKNRHQYNAYMRDYLKKRYHSRRSSIIQMMGGLCSLCGSTERLEIDHVRTADKSFDIGKRMHGMNKGELQIELNKCQLLCRKCHEKKTSDDLGNKVHGAYWMYRKGKCRCDACVSYFRSRGREDSKRRREKRRALALLNQSLA